MTAAWSVDMPSGDKLVLLALADCANDEGHCWPGLASLARKTGKCKRSLQESLRTLDGSGHITRVENPGKGMNYTVHPVAKSAPVEAVATGGKNKCRPVAKSAHKPSVTVISSEPKGSSPRPWALPAGVNLQTWTDFLTNRKRKRLPNTETSWKTFQDDLARVSIETGIPPPKLIEKCTGKGWGGIYDPNERDQRNERPSNPTAIAVQRLTGAFGTHH